MCRLATGRRNQDGDATDQWRNYPNAVVVCLLQLVDCRESSKLIGYSFEEHSKPHNWLDLSSGCLGATCQAWSTLITLLVSGVAGLSASSDISQGSVATCLRSGTICSNSFITNCLLILTVKNFENRLILFGKIIRCTKWCHFWPILYTCLLYTSDAADE